MEIKKLIFKIKRKIMEYESKMNFYKKTELEYLEKIPSIYNYMVNLNEFKKIDLIYAGIILGDKYDDFELIKCLPEDLIKIINEFDFDKFEIMLSENMIFPGCSTIRRIYFPFVEISFFAVDNDIKSV